MIEADARAPLAFVCGAYHRGGVTRWMADLSAEWKRRGGACWFVVPAPRRPFYSCDGRPTMIEILAAIDAPLRPEIVTAPAGRLYELGTGRYRSAVYEAAILRGVPEGVPLLLGDDPAAWDAATRLGRCGRHPTIGVMHSDDPRYDHLARRFGASVDTIVAVSRRVRARVTSAAPSLTLPIPVIPCGTPLPPPARRPEAGQNGTLRLIWVGRVEEYQKRVSDLPRIVDHLRSVHTDCTLDIIGDGPSLSALQDAVRKAAHGARISLYGWRDAEFVRQRLAAADVFVLPSNFEGMPVAMMEALALGCGVVAAQVSGVEDVATLPGARGCVWTHPVGDVTAAVTAILDAARADPGERAARARALAEAEFSIEQCAVRYEPIVRRRIAPFMGVGSRPSLGARIAQLVSYPVAAQRLARLRSMRTSGG